MLTSSTKYLPRPLLPRYLPTRFSACVSKWECAEYLLSKGARLDTVDNSEVTSVMLAAGGGHESCLEVLLGAATAATPAEYESDKSTLLDVADAEGRNASHYACKAGEAGALTLLANAGANLDLPSGISEAGNALHPAHLTVVYGFLFCLEVLAEWGVDLEATDGDGETVLSLAVQCGSEACAEFLLSGGDPDGRPLVDPNRPTTRQERPLSVAARRGKLSLLSLLLKAGADPAATDSDGETAVHAAARHGQVAVIEALAQATNAEGGADNASTQDGASADGPGLPAWWFMTTNAGETATFIASREGNVGICKALQAISALEPSCPNMDGVTPMVVAALAGHSEVSTQRSGLGGVAAAVTM